MSFRRRSFGRGRGRGRRRGRRIGTFRRRIGIRM